MYHVIVNPPVDLPNWIPFRRMCVCVYCTHIWIGWTAAAEHLFKLFFPLSMFINVRIYAGIPIWLLWYPSQTYFTYVLGNNILQSLGWSCLNCISIVCSNCNVINIYGVDEAVAYVSAVSWMCLLSAPYIHVLLFHFYLMSIHKCNFWTVNICGCYVKNRYTYYWYYMRINSFLLFKQTELIFCHHCIFANKNMHAKMNIYKSRSLNLYFAEGILWGNKSNSIRVG